MEKRLNLPALKEAAARAGKSQTDIAKSLSVTRAAVSKWFNGESFPQPALLLRLGVMLGLAFDRLVLTVGAPPAPIVNFRHKRNRKTQDRHRAEAAHAGDLLRRLATRVPQFDLVQPSVLRTPQVEYPYIQRVAEAVRQEMGLTGRSGIEIEDLAARFKALNAIIIPVLWGAREQHGNALNIHLPDSMTTWVFLNLDSRVLDFKFWMAHELGHSLAPGLSGDAAEDFADQFAQALLFPQEHAARLYDYLRSLPTVAARLAAMLAEAKRNVISPFTVFYAVRDHAKWLGLEDVAVPVRSAGATFARFEKGYRTMAEELFPVAPIEPKDFVEQTGKKFSTPFFSMLREYARDSGAAEHYLREVLGMGIVDAKGLAAELAR